MPVSPPSSRIWLSTWNRSILVQTMLEALRLLFQVNLFRVTFRIRLIGTRPVGPALELSHTRLGVLVAFFLWTDFPLLCHRDFPPCWSLRRQSIVPVGGESSRLYATVWHEGLYDCERTRWWFLKWYPSARLGEIINSMGCDWCCDSGREQESYPFLVRIFFCGVWCFVP